MGKPRRKFCNLLAAGTGQVWVVRLVGPQRVEAHRPEGPMKVYIAGDVLEAPGILRNPVPVRVLFDRDAAHDVVFRNLLQRRGYASLNDVHEEGREEGREEEIIEAILVLLQGRGLAVDAEVEARLRACHDRESQRRWLLNAAAHPELFSPEQETGLEMATRIPPTVSKRTKINGKLRQE
jgi:hypothetical protein